MNSNVLHPFSSVTHPNLSKTHDAALQNVTLQKRGMKLCTATYMYLHVNACPTRMKAYENKILHMSDKTINDEPVRVCITNSNYERKDMGICNFL